VTRSKKIFAGLAIVFLIALFYASYDISTRTTFPGSKPQLKERLQKKYLKKDTLAADSVTQSGK
jgi:biotin carboxylase